MPIKRIIPQNLKNIYHLIQAVLANFWFGFPSQKIKIIGVTGTNGKTTTAQMIAKILEEAGFKTAMISTINFKLDKKEWVNKTKFTTLSSWATQKFIKKAVAANCDYLVLETSSHSLDQHRVWGIKYNTAVITNITREHLDYHKTMKKYRRAKLKLFKNVEIAVVNLEMEKPEDFILNDANRIYGYALKNQNLKLKNQNHNSQLKTIIAEDIELGINKSNYKLQITNYKLNLPGRFNIENALAAICVGLAEGISLETSAKALEKIKGIPGRMENVPNNKGLNIIIDYALTPDSLEKLYRLISEIKKRKGGEPKVVAVFGACGERDRGKRPIMGEIVSRFADYVIVTNEDPYNEDPQKIINEVFSGVENKNCWRILDRKEAIKKALQLVKPGDFVVITGKGAEETMAIGNKRIPWNDKKVILEVLREI